MENKSICITDINGNKTWFIDGEYHREDGPAIEYKNGTNQWYINGKLHRLDGPAVEFTTGTKIWYFHGKVHRLDGHAIEYKNGESRWYVNDCDITSEIYPWAKENDIDLDNLSEVDKTLIKIIWTHYEEK